MSTAKKVSATTQLRKVINENKSLTTQVSDLEKRLKLSEQAKDSFSKRLDEHAAEVEQVHALLDVLAGAPARTNESSPHWDKSVKAMTRLAGYLATRGNQ